MVHHRISIVCSQRIEKNNQNKSKKRNCFSGGLWYERKNSIKQRKRTKFTVK